MENIEIILLSTEHHLAAVVQILRVRDELLSDTGHVLVLAKPGQVDHLPYTQTELVQRARSCCLAVRVLRKHSHDRVEAKVALSGLFQEVLALLEKILAFLKKAAGNNSFVDQVSNVAEVETSADLLDLVEEAAEIACRDPVEEDEEDAGVNQVFLGCHSCLRSYQLCDS